MPTYIRAHQYNSVKHQLYCFHWSKQIRKKNHAKCSKYSKNTKYRWNLRSFSLTPVPIIKHKVWRNQTIWISPRKVQTNELVNASDYILLSINSSQDKKLFTRNKDLYNLLKVISFWKIDCSVLNSAIEEFLFKTTKIWQPKHELNDCICQNIKTLKTALSLKIIISNKGG